MQMVWYDFLVTVSHNVCCRLGGPGDFLESIDVSIALIHLRKIAK